jgi:hypothetical protein
MPKLKFYALKLCLLCIIVFILQLIIPGFTNLFVLNKSAIYNYEYWRFISSIFLHGSLPHLLYNVFALALFGTILEKLIGGKRFLLVFFASGIIANLIAVNFYNSSLGASGAIYGVLGCLAVIRPLMVVWAFGFPMPMFVAAMLWVGAGVLGIFMPSNIGDIAHLSGIAVGFLIGILLREWRTTKKGLIKFPEGYMRLWENKHMRQ